MFHSKILRCAPTISYEVQLKFFILFILINEIKCTSIPLCVQQVWRLIKCNGVLCFEFLESRPCHILSYIMKKIKIILVGSRRPEGIHIFPLTRQYLQNNECLPSIYEELTPQKRSASALRDRVSIQWCFAAQGNWINKLKLQFLLNLTNILK